MCIDICGNIHLSHMYWYMRLYLSIIFVWYGYIHPRYMIYCDAKYVQIFTGQSEQLETWPGVLQSADRLSAGPRPRSAPFWQMTRHHHCHWLPCCMGRSWVLPSALYTNFQHRIFAWPWYGSHIGKETHLFCLGLGSRGVGNGGCSSRRQRASKKIACSWRKHLDLEHCPALHPDTPEDRTTCDQSWEFYAFLQTQHCLCIVAQQ